jgi:hypothetical protein
MNKITREQEDMVVFRLPSICVQQKDAFMIMQVVSHFMSEIKSKLYLCHEEYGGESYIADIFKNGEKYDTYIHAVQDFNILNTRLLEVLETVEKPVKVYDNGYVNETELYKYIAGCEDNQ